MPQKCGILFFEQINFLVTFCIMLYYFACSIKSKHKSKPYLSVLNTRIFQHTALSACHQGKCFSFAQISMLIQLLVIGEKHATELVCNLKVPTIRVSLTCLKKPEFMVKRRNVA